MPNGRLTRLLTGFIERMVPKRHLKRYELLLYSAGINFKASEYLGISVMVGIVSGLILILMFFNPLYGIAGFFGGFLAFAIIYPYWKVSRRIEEMEKMLPDAFFYLASSLRAGVSFSEAMEELTTAKFGALTEEFKRTVAEIKRGRPTIDALRAFAMRNRKSAVLYRSMMIIIEALERGAPMADVLVAVANDVREILRIKKERKAATGMQMMFFMAASGFIGPLILAVISKITEGMSGAQLGFTLPVDAIRTILGLFVVAQAFVSGLGIGVIREGNFSAGLKYGAIMIAMGILVFILGTKMEIGGFGF
ncbi:type II secretion system F family protein [Pyrococcus yayanosii]|uniref:Bacterial type II secretion system protein F domain, putative n=1 Tax=Pyrococcus yayanosii (strain CH1 / JCM 16557) TaxID=529709 RepID=F8AEN2_PYRYC|nr:type II secretion system F family protein [Pyrococcus yayanosii]AEH24712.1 Bacterial type II secretion system protein F domain, putative [Pyrococcus yayanosii CH1]